MLLLAYSLVLVPSNCGVGNNPAPALFWTFMNFKEGTLMPRIVSSFLCPNPKCRAPIAPSATAIRCRNCFQDVTKSLETKISPTMGSVGSQVSQLIGKPTQEALRVLEDICARTDLPDVVLDYCADLWTYYQTQ
jgi:hypothetical protein